MLALLMLLVMMLLMHTARSPHHGPLPIARPHTRTQARATQSVSVPPRRRTPDAAVPYDTAVVVATETRTAVAACTGGTGGRGRCGRALLLRLLLRLPLSAAPRYVYGAGPVDVHGWGVGGGGGGGGGGGRGRGHGGARWRRGVRGGNGQHSAPRVHSVLRRGGGHLCRTLSFRSGWLFPVWEGGGGHGGEEGGRDGTESDGLGQVSQRRRLESSVGRERWRL